MASVNTEPPVQRKLAYQHKLADDPSWTIMTLEITYPPGGCTPPHHHGPANLFAYVLEGEILSVMNDEEAKVYRAGRELSPGYRHRLSVNNSKTERARFMATYVVKTEVLEREGSGILLQVEPEKSAQV